MSNIKLAQRLRNSLREGQFADVHFQVSDKQQDFAAHRVILASASPVFSAMFSSDLSTCQDTFQISDIDPEAFQNLLDFAYTDSVSGINETSVFATLYAAKKYMITDLASACCNFLTNSLSADNVLDIMEQCLFLDVHSVVTVCSAFACQHWDLVMPRLQDCQVEVVIEVLSQSTLPCSETEAFTCLLNWLDAECERRSLGQPGTASARLQALEASGSARELLACIRFGNMSRLQLAELVVPSGLLNSEQLVQTITRTGLASSCSPRFVIMENLKVEPISIYDYSSLWRPEQSVPHPVSMSGSLDLRCMRRMALCGCELFRPKTPNAIPPLISISVRSCDDPDDAPLPDCVCDDAKHQSGQLIPYYTAYFPRPAVLMPGRWYRLRISLSDALPHSMADAPLPEPGNKAILLSLRTPDIEPYAAFLCALLCHYTWPMPSDASASASPHTAAS